MDLDKRWLSFVGELAMTEPYLFAGNQAIYPNVEWTFPAGELLNDTTMTLANIGFTKTKIQHLTRHYYNAGTIARARQDLWDRLEQKKYGSGVWDFRGEEKKTTKQDYCLTAGVIAYYPPHKHTRIFINYRTVELIFRYRADLIFLRDVILPEFELERCLPDTITFRFVNCTIHPMFTIMFLLQHKRPRQWLIAISKHNPKFYRQVIRWTTIHLNGGYRSYATAARVQKFVDKHDSSLVKDLKKIMKDHKV